MFLQTGFGLFELLVLIEQATFMILLTRPTIRYLRIHTWHTDLLAWMPGVVILISDTSRA